MRWDLLRAVIFLWLAAIASPVSAGYLAETNFDVVNNTGVGWFGASPGDTFAITAGTIAALFPDAPADLHIPAGTLHNYGYTMNGTAVSVAGGVVHYHGTYEIFYNLDGNNTRNPGDLRVSAGTLTAEATIVPLLNMGVFNGQLTQTQGPQIPSLPDVSYGGNPIDWFGIYVGIPLFPAIATMQSTLRQDVLPVPEPTSFAVLAIGLAGLVCFRKRRGHRQTVNRRTRAPLR
jgi:hypothetical protein